MVACVERLASKWRGCVVTFFIDNSAFMQSGAKGRSRANRLNDLLRELFGLMIKFGFVIMWTWIATDDNVNADHLSRGRVAEFFRTVYETGVWTEATVPEPMPDVGRTRTLPEGRGALARNLAEEGLAAAAAAAADGRNYESSSTNSSTSRRQPDSDEARVSNCESSSTNTSTSPRQPDSDEARSVHADVGVDPPDGEAPVKDETNFADAVRPGVTLTELLARASADRPGDERRPEGRPEPMPVVPVRGRWATGLVLLVFGLCVVGGDCMPLSAQQASLSYSRASIYDGLPGSLTDVMHEVMDNRLSSSSWRTVSAGVAIWGTVCAAYGWERVLRTDDPLRGGKLAAFVLHMTTKTTLVYGSIENYVWGVRVWMQSQMVVDPLMGVLFWPSFMQAIKVLTWVPGEPRRAVPHAVVEAIIDMVEARYLHDFFAVQMVFLILVLYYSFSRTECPCPKSFAGRECYDKDVHWNVYDFDIRIVAGVRALFVRFRSSRILGRSGRRRGRARGTGRASATCPIPSGRSSGGTRGCSSCTAGPSLADVLGQG